MRYNVHIATKDIDMIRTDVFPDTKAGVIAFMSDPYYVKQKFTKSLDLPKCKIWPDPVVEGVWAIDNPETRQRVIVYLCGYKTPWGNKREFNDFEEGEIP